MDQPVSGWSTLSEVRFLEALGRAAPACARIGRAELLRRYIAAMDLRANWGSMDVAGIDRVAKTALRQVEDAARCVLTLR